MDKIELECLPSDCESTLTDSEAALIAIAHAVDNIGAAFSDDTGEPDTGSATVNIYRLAAATERAATALEEIVIILKNRTEQTP